MKERSTITRNDLIEWGIVAITNDGDIYGFRKNEVKKLKPHLVTCKHKYGTDMHYYVVGRYDKETKKQSNIIVSRAVYAWHYGICPGDLDVDHIDNNTLNNSIDNLQLLSRKDNINKRPPCNQYIKMWPQWKQEQYKRDWYREHGVDESGK